MIKPCEDHKGNAFQSKKEMAKYWKIPYYTLIRRLNMRWSLEKGAWGNRCGNWF